MVRIIGMDNSVGQELAIPRGRLRVSGNRPVLGIRIDLYDLF